MKKLLWLVIVALSGCRTYAVPNIKSCIYPDTRSNYDAHGAYAADVHMTWVRECDSIRMVAIYRASPNGPRSIRCNLTFETYEQTVYLYSGRPLDINVGFYYKKDPMAYADCW